MNVDIVPLTTPDTYDIRKAVLRADMATQNVQFAEDNWDGVFHLGARVGKQLVAVSTWIPRDWDDGPAIQLRGMAVLAHMQGSGCGGGLVEAGCAQCDDRGFPLVWARARDAALPFYQRHQFQVVGAGYVDATTDLPHHTIVRLLNMDHRMPANLTELAVDRHLRGQQHRLRWRGLDDDF